MSKDLFVCICCGAPWRPDSEFHDEHHRWPKSQNGPDTPDNKVKVCRDCHSFYNAICGQVLAKKAKARIENFIKWMKQFPQQEIMGPRNGIHPADMAPEFVQEEAGYFILTGLVMDYSDNRLSRIGKVEEYPMREHLNPGGKSCHQDDS